MENNNILYDNYSIYSILSEYTAVFCHLIFCDITRLIDITLCVTIVTTHVQ